MESIMSVELAQKKLDDIKKAERDLTGEVGVLRQKLTEAEKSTGDKILEAHLSGDAKSKEVVIQALVRLKCETDASERALAASKTAKVYASSDLLRSKAEENRKTALELHKLADERQKKADVFLKQLKDFEGCDFVPFVPTHSRLGPGERIEYPIAKTAGIRRDAEHLERLSKEQDENADTAIKMFKAGQERTRNEKGR
ncbi:MAG: hypothetical protein ACYDDV_00390 [Methanoregula sp.]